MSSVCLHVHTGRDDAIDTARSMARRLLAGGHRVVATSAEMAILDIDGCHVDEGSGPIELVVSIGGDGTMLRASRRAVEGDAEVLGVNLGRLGYLAEVEPTAWEDALDRWFAGDYTVTERLLVGAEVWRAGEAHDEPGITVPPGLNELVVEKVTKGRTIMISVSIDASHFTNYVADGVIIATPTGSTAYSLSARGPIVAPAHRALILTAVSPHSLFDRSLVLEPSSVLDLTLLGDRPAGVAVDGETFIEIEPGGRVRVTASDRPARFVSFGERNFHQVLKAKFGLSDR